MAAICNSSAIQGNDGNVAAAAAAMVVVVDFTFSTRIQSQIYSYRITSCHAAIIQVSVIFYFHIFSSFFLSPLPLLSVGVLAAAACQDFRVYTTRVLFSTRYFRDFVAVIVFFFLK